MNKERLPRWGWLLAGLFAMSILANLLNILVFYPAGLPPEYQAITVITLMSPVLIYVGLWYDEDRQHYWEQSQEQIVGDLLFIIAGAALGSALVLAAIADAGLAQLITDVVAMAAGFMLSWGLFWWRNPSVYNNPE